jgi:HSP20 family protein
VDDFFNNFDHQLTNSLFSIADNTFSPRLDISETDSDYCLELDLPGINKEDIDIKLDNNIIIIKGEKKLNNEHKDTNFYTRERFYGTFSRTLALPTNIKSEEVETTFEGGVLNIKIPKTKASSTKQIKIK